jgi:hypothetical protein
MGGADVTDEQKTAAALLLPITIRLTTAETAALSFVAVMVTSAVDVAVVNAADRGLLKLREAAAGHVR